MFNFFSHLNALLFGNKFWNVLHFYTISNLLTLFVHSFFYLYQQYLLQKQMILYKTFSR